MPYKCVHCGNLIEDASQQLLVGCGECKSKFFFYIKKEKLEELKKKKDILIDLNEEEKKQIEEDIRDIVGVTDEETPVFLDFESIKVLKPGKYLLDIARLFEMGKPQVYQLEDGKYVVDFSLTKQKNKQ
jgi:predicted  nucleic acid-binding Zn-ribbon protein